MASGQEPNDDNESQYEKLTIGTREHNMRTQYALPRNTLEDAKSVILSIIIDYIRLETMKVVSAQRNRASAPRLHQR